MMQIYQIYNTNTRKSYVGQSVDHIRRFKRHKQAADNHENGRLYHSINHHGIGAFELRLVEELGSATNQEVNNREIFWISEMKTLFPDGYNMTLGGGGVRGLKCSDSTRQKLSMAGMGRVDSEETRQKRSLAQKGKVASDESRRKMSEAKKGKARSKETIRKLSESHKGKVHSKETRQKISESLKGKVHSEESRRKMSGKVRSVEHRRKLSEANKGRVFSEEHRRKIYATRIGRVHSAETRQKMSAAHKARIEYKRNIWNLQ